MFTYKRAVICLKQRDARVCTPTRNYQVLVHGHIWPKKRKVICFIITLTNRWKIIWQIWQLQSRQNFQDTNDEKVENKHILKPCRQDDVLLRLQSWLKCKPNSCIKEGGIGIFNFGFFLDRFFGFCAKKLRFLGFWCSFSFFQHLVFGFREKY